MQIQVKTDNHTQGSAELTRQVVDVVENALLHLADRTTRVEVHLSDVNSSQKFGEKDKRCVMEARLAGLTPITVSHRGTSPKQVIDGAASKLEKTLKRALGRKNSLFKRRARVRTEIAALDSLLQRDAVSADPFIPGVLDRISRSICIDDVVDLHVDDMLDDLAELVMSKGGEVVVVPAERMPADTGVAAVYRF